MKYSNELSSIIDHLPQHSNVGLSFEVYPLEKWSPTSCGVIDLVIKKDGLWWHDGSVIKRDRLITLFSKLLCKENEIFYLKTPVEKIKISVEDAPFLIVDYEILRDNHENESIILKSNIGGKLPVATSR